MSNITEDDLTNALVQEYQDSGLGKEIYPEAHYNHYGDRGVADLYVDEGWGCSLYEIKSERAVKKSETGANSILRQFNKMRSYFFKDESWQVPYESTKDGNHCSISFHLVFTPTKSNFAHLLENSAMYEQTVTNELFNGDEFAIQFDKTVFISMNVLESPFRPIPFFHSGWGRVSRERLEQELARHDFNWPVDQFYED